MSAVSDVSVDPTKRGAQGGRRAIAPLGAVVLDCPDPMTLAGFYAEVLGVEVADDSDDDWASLAMASPSLSFQRVESYRRPEWPDGTPQQFHLDFEVTSYQPAHDRLLTLGATPLDPTTPPAEGDRSFRVYADPVGHPFCLCRCAADATLGIGH